jgi:hypothetical protein
MRSKRYIRAVLRGLTASAGLGAAAYTTYVAVTWFRYGRPKKPVGDQADLLLDRFMPVYEVVERHHLCVAAPADLTFAAACDVDLNQSAIIRAIFRGREWILGAEPGPPSSVGSLLSLMQALGWGVLAEEPGREIVIGAVTQPWVADVVFHPLSPPEFIAFHEPGFVKIAWTLRADPVGEAESLARTETRVVATDPAARSRFRQYWSFFSPGIVLIRRIALGLVKKDAERRMDRRLHNA